MWETLIRCLSINRSQISQIVNLQSRLRIVSTARLSLSGEVSFNRLLLSWSWMFSHFVWNWVPTNVQRVQASCLHHTHFVDTCVEPMKKDSLLCENVSQHIRCICQKHASEEVPCLPRNKTHGTQPFFTKLYIHCGITLGSTCYPYQNASVTTADFQKVRQWLVTRLVYNYNFQNAYYQELWNMPKRGSLWKKLTTQFQKNVQKKISQFLRKKFWNAEKWINFSGKILQIF